MADYTGVMTPSMSEEGSSVETMDPAQSRAAREQHEKLVAWTKQQFQMIKSARLQTERQWYMNLAFYMGKQNVAILKPQASGMGFTTRFYVPPAPYYRSRPVINRIRPTIRTELSQLTNNKPSATVVPASAEDRDMYAALAGEQIFDSMYREHNLKRVIRKTALWTLICGTGFIKTYWDPRKGPKLPKKDPISGEALTDPMTGQPVLEVSGDVCYTAETPFHVFVPDLREEELEEQPFIIHAQVKSPDWVKMNFPEALDGTPINPNSSQASDVLEENFLNLIGTQTPQKMQSVLVLEVWVKPGMVPMAPEGMYFTLVGDKIVQGFSGWPFNHDEYPFSKFDHIPAGKFYATSTIEDLIPIQKEYNRTRGQLIEAKNRMAKPQLLAPRGSVNAAQITTEPGLVIQYTPGFDPPTPIPLSAMPQYVVQEIDRCLNDWNDISGQHEVSHGQVPPGVTAATAISYLQERDESKLSHTFDSLEEGIEKVAKQTLSIVNQFWTDERLIKVVGPDGSFDAQAFKGSDIDNGMDIRVEAGSSLPVSKAAKQALITDWMQMGFIDPQDGLEVMDMGGINKIYDRIQIDQRQVQRENMRMAKVNEDALNEYNQNNQKMMAASVQQQEEEIGAEFEQTGQPPVEEDPETGQLIPKQPDPLKPWDGNQPPLIVPVNTWDNHEAHIQLHNNYRKGQAFESLPDETKVLFEIHVQQHMMALGMEQVTTDPTVAAGLIPPEQALAQAQEQGMPGGSTKSGTGGGQPGPEPMPQAAEQEGMPV